jgi:LysR family transcriptional regulator, low CO2-responsive transcriptional regulator
MRSFSEAYQDVELMLEVGNREAVLQRVLGHSVDVAFSGKPPSDPRLVAEPIDDNEIVCITAPNDPAVGREALEASDLERYRWLLREPGSGTRALNQKYLSDNGLAPQTLTLGSNGAIKQAARAGLGISLLSRAAVQSELAASQVAELALSDPPATRPWFLLRAAAGPLRPAVQAFIEFVLRTMRRAA